jgi:hypothetical protein
VLRKIAKTAFHPDDTQIVARVWDEGDGQGMAGK